MLKVKKGDTVQVLSGNDKTKTGEVLQVIPKTEKIIVKGVNIRKKHVKPRKQGEESGIIPVECPIHMSKVNVVCPKCGKAKLSSLHRYPEDRPIEERREQYWMQHFGIKETAAPTYHSAATV